MVAKRQRSDIKKFVERPHHSRYSVKSFRLLPYVVVGNFNFSTVELTSGQKIVDGDKIDYVYVKNILNFHSSS